jgi:hypothetical protein
VLRQGILDENNGGLNKMKILILKTMFETLEN